MQLSQIQNNCSENIQPSNDSPETLELQPIPCSSRIINVAPVNVESDEIPRNETHPRARDISNDLTNPPNNPVSIPSSMQVLCLNNNKHNRNLVSFSGSICLSITIVAIVFIISWNVHENGDVENFILPWYIVNFCLSVGLPILYFTMNPRHLIIAVQDLPCSI